MQYASHSHRAWCFLLCQFWNCIWLFCFRPVFLVAMQQNGKQYHSMCDKKRQQRNRKGNHTHHQIMANDIACDAPTNGFESNGRSDSTMGCVDDGDYYFLWWSFQFVFRIGLDKCTFCSLRPLRFCLQTPSDWSLKRRSTDSACSNGVHQEIFMKTCTAR